MTIKLNKLEIPSFRKLIGIQNIKVGKKITVFSGLNGVGKSNILSLIASGSGLNRKRESGDNFQPNFTEYFKVENSEDVENYKIFLEYIDTEDGYTFGKRVGFKDDTETGRGIRIIPRNSNYFQNDRKISEVSEEIKAKYNIGPSARVKIPTVFVSLSRLYPLGEGEISTKKISNKNNFITQKAHDKYKEWYNFVLPNSIESDVENVSRLSKSVTNTNSFYMSIENTTPQTQSVGQDNLGHIITPLVDLYLISLQDDYSGGILCIDEIDASLHPSAQIRLIDLLTKLTDELNLQIFLSSHSLTFLKEIIRLHGEDPDGYELVYFKDTRFPIATTYKNYRSLKADLFDEQNVPSPKVKLYCEDTETERLLNLLVQTAKNLNLFDNILPEYEIVPVFLGCNQLMKLPRYDDHFKKVGIILDGDARSDKKIHIGQYIENPKIINGYNTINHSNTIVFLPGFLPPESYLYSVIHEYIINQQNHLDFWRFVINTPETTNYTSSRIKSDILDLNPSKNDDLKKNGNSNKIFLFCEMTNILTDYYKNNSKELTTFANVFANMLIKLQKQLKARGY